MQNTMSDSFVAARMAAATEARIQSRRELSEEALDENSPPRRLVARAIGVAEAEVVSDFWNEVGARAEHEGISLSDAYSRAKESLARRLIETAATVGRSSLAGERERAEHTALCFVAASEL